MKNFTDYAEKAISRFGLSGYNNLAREIGVTKCVMSQFRHNKATPSDETFLKIVELAGMPKEEALIDLNLWRSKDKPELQKVWQRLSKMIGCLLTFLVVATSDVNACNIVKKSPISETSNNQYYILCDKYIYN